MPPLPGEAAVRVEIPSATNHDIPGNRLALQRIRPLRSIGDRGTANLQIANKQTVINSRVLQPDPSPK